MAQWDIPHDEKHRFLQWGMRDELFDSWCSYFDSRNVAYEIGGGRDSWTLYKHMLHTRLDTRKITRCCPMDSPL